MRDSPWEFPEVLSGHGVQLRALSTTHAEALALAAKPEAFEFLSRWPKSYDLCGMRVFIDDMLRIPNAQMYSVSANGIAPMPIGITGFLDIAPTHRRLEIGWTWLTPAAWGTGVNTAMKSLMLAYAFEQLRVVRATLTADSRNARSISAIQSLGALQEGVLRNAAITQSGYIRDTIVFGIIDTEWPRSKSLIRGRLESHNSSIHTTKAPDLPRVQDNSN